MNIPPELHYTVYRELHNRKKKRYLVGFVDLVEVRRLKGVPITTVSSLETQTETLPNITMFGNNRVGHRMQWKEIVVINQEGKRSGKNISACTTIAVLTTRHFEFLKQVLHSWVYLTNDNDDFISVKLPAFNLTHYLRDHKINTLLQ